MASVGDSGSGTCPHWTWAIRARSRAIGSMARVIIR